MLRNGYNVSQIAAELKKQGKLNMDQTSQFLHDIDDPSRLEVVANMIDGMTPKDLLKFYIQANYGNQRNHEQQAHSRLRISYQELKKKKDSQRCTKTKEIPANHKLIQMMNEFTNCVKEKYHTSTKFLSEIICNRKQKQIQSYFGRLIELLIGTNDYAYICWESNQINPKIEYFNANLNYLTVFLKGQPEHHEAISLSKQFSNGVHLLDSSHTLFSNTFNCKSGNYIVQAINNKTQTILFAISSDKSDLYSRIQQDPQLAHIYQMFVQQAVHTLHVSKFEVVKQYCLQLSTQVTLKSILSLLEFSIRVNARMFQLHIEQVFRENKASGTISQIIEYLQNGTPEEKLIKQLYEDVCDRIFRYQTNIDRYKLQVSQNFKVYINFNPFGELRFISNKLPSGLYKKLMAKHRSEDEQITIFDLFEKESEALQYFEEAVDGKIFEEFLQIQQDKYNGYLSFNYKGDGTLKSLCCSIDLKSKITDKPEKSQTSFKNLSMDTIVSTDSERDVTSQIRQGTGINKQAQRMLLELQQQRPGVSKTGWLEAFMKNDILDKYSRKKPPGTRKDVQDEKENSKKRMSISLGIDPDLQVQKALSMMERFDLNLLQLDKQHLIPLAKSMLGRLRFSISQSFDQTIVDNFLRDMAAKYSKHNNPFHNFTHGLNVMHMCYLFSKLECNKDYLTDLNAFTLVFSGLCHDVGHPGRTNPFQISSGSKKACRYNDRSPLQNYHAATSYKILLRPGNNFLSSVKKEHFNQIRKEFISNILATDIKEHFPLLNNFEAKLKSPKGFEKTPADVELTTNILIHASDFSGASMTFDISRKWAQLVNKEFSSQYEAEGQLGIPQTSYMKNLDKEDVLAQNEAGFMKVIVRPLFKALSDYYTKEEDVKRLLKNVDENMLIWEKIATQYKARQAKP